MTSPFLTGRWQNQDYGTGLLTSEGLPLDGTCQLGRCNFLPLFLLPSHFLSIESLGKF